MKTIIITLICIVLSFSRLHALVDFGGTWVAPFMVYPACHGQEHVSVGFHVNWELNNQSFEIQRSTDPQFSWAIVVHTITGCGTCGYSMHNFVDVGPFQPGQVWHYRVVAHGSTNSQFKNLGSYTSSMPSIVNWVSQVTNQFMTGVSPSTESSYTWFNESRSGQGVNISLAPTEVSNIYLELNNHKINFLALVNNPFIQIEVNKNNLGYSTIYSGSGVSSYTWNSTSTFNVLGNFNLKVRFTTINSTVYTREFNVFVVPQSDALYMDNFCNTMRVWKGNDPVNGIPLILSEGFDAYNTKPQQYYRESGKDLINCLLQKGFNVYIVDYYLNSQSIINNAAVFQSAIRYVSSINNNRKVVATGMSMGGIINRYACAQAESVSNPLPISKFVSIDAPHKGAVLSPDMQDWRKANTSDPFEIAASDNDAAKQLLKYNAYDPSGVVRSLFNIILNTVNQDGYPHLVESIGIAFSTNSPNPNSGGWLAVTPSAVQSQTVFQMSNDEMLAGSYLPQIVIDPLHFYIPLIRISVNITQLKSPCFIPHESALDIHNGVSKFDKVIIPPATFPHDKIPPAIIEEIVNALLEDQIYVQNKTISTGRTSSARIRLSAGQQVNPQQSSGVVNVTSNSDVVFKAGVEVALRDGFQSISGSEFAAIIGTVSCDNSLEFQNRVAALPDEQTELNTGFAIPPEYLNDNRFHIEYNTGQYSSISHSGEPELLPNPTEGLVYLNGILDDELDYEVYGMDHKLLKSGICRNRSIDLSELAKGLYLVKLIDKQKTIHNFKVIRN